MLSIQRLFAKGDNFFDLLDASAEESRGAARALIKLLRSSQDGWTLDEFLQRRRENKRINEQITSLLCSTFVTPLEREDIETLARVLYRIPKTIEKFGERLLLLPLELRPEFFEQQAVLLDHATESVCQMVRELRRRPRMDQITEQNDRLHQIEGEADKLIMDLLRDLYSGRHELLQVIVLRDLFEMLEKVIDRCRDAGNVVFQIVLKHS